MTWSLMPGNEHLARRRNSAKLLSCEFMIPLARG
jgi:hypothetical protein